MRTFLRLLGGIWAALGVMNIMQSPSLDPASKSMVGPEWVIIFNVVFFIGPGLLLAGIGSIIKKNVSGKKCPACAEMVKQEATKCRFCNTNLAD